MEAGFRIILVALIAIFSAAHGSFPLAELSSYDDLRMIPETIHVYNSTTMLGTVYGYYPTNLMGFHPQVSVPSKLDAGRALLVFRFNYKTNIVDWGRAFQADGQVIKSCTDPSNNIYTFAGSSGVECYGYISIRKFSPNGILLWEQFWNTCYDENIKLAGEYFECISNDIVAIAAKKKGRPHLVLIDAHTAIIKSMISVPAKVNQKFGTSFGTGSLNGTVCMFTYVGNLFSGPNGEGFNPDMDLYIHCIHTRNRMKVTTRKLDSYEGGPNIHKKFLMVLTPRESGFKCAAVYVMYPFSVNQPPEAKEPYFQLKIRKLCLNSLKDMPWHPRGRSYERFIFLDNNYNQAQPENLLYVKKLRSIALVFQTYNYNSTGKVRSSGYSDTLLGTRDTSGLYREEERWVFIYGRKRKPIVTAFPVKQNPEKGYSFPTPYNGMTYGDVTLSPTGHKFLVYGQLRQDTTNTRIFGTLSVREFDLPSY